MFPHHLDGDRRRIRAYFFLGRAATQWNEDVESPAPGSLDVGFQPVILELRTEEQNNNKLGGNSQKLILFSLGKAISGPPTNNGNKKLPNPPIKAGITIKNIIKIA